MRRVVLVLSVAVFLTAFFTATERQAHAYADPGSGMLLIQTAGSVITAAGIYFRRAIYGWFRKDKPQETPAETNPATAGK